MKPSAKIVLTLCVLASGRISIDQTLAQTFDAWPVTRVAAGEGHVLFTKSDGSLWVIGDNTHGQLGLGPAVTNRNIPQRLTSGVASIACGENHSLFVSGHTLWGMGQNTSGQLGDGSTSNRFVPEQIFSAGFNFIPLVACGSLHSLFATTSVTLSGATLRCMGLNEYGELGDGGITNHHTPEIILQGQFFSAIAGGAVHSLFIKPDGSLWGMGNNIYGQLGLGFLNSSNPTPVKIVGSNVIAVAAGGDHSLFIESDGTLRAMGFNVYGQLGLEDQNYADHVYPSLVLDPLYYGLTVTAVAAGNSHSLYITSDGSLWAVGDGTFGQLGDGRGFYNNNTDFTDTPERIVTSNVVAVAAGGSTSYFIKSDGSLWGMGNNGSGQLGTGDYLNRFFPVQIVAPPPRINVYPFGANILLAWGTNAAGFKLQFTTNLLFPGAWTNVTTAPILVGDQFEYLAPISGPRKFFRLRQ